MTKGGQESKGVGITSGLTTIIQQIEIVEQKVDRVEEMLGKLEQ